MIPREAVEKLARHMCERHLGEFIEAWRANYLAEARDILDFIDAEIISLKELEKP